MARPIRRMPTPAGIGAGQTASLTLPLGLTYHTMLIRMKTGANGGNDVTNWGAALGEIRLLVDGDTTYQIDAGDLDKLNSFYGQPGSAGTLAIHLSRPWMRTIAGEDQTSYGTAGGMSSFAMEMDINSGVTVADLDVYAVQGPGTPFGPHIRMQRHVHTQGVTGEAEISDLPRGPFSLLGLHFTTSAIEDVEVHIDNRKVTETDRAVRAHMFSQIGRSPQIDMTHVDVLTENRLVEALPMNVSDFRIKADFTAPGNYAIYSETVRGGL